MQRMFRGLLIYFVRLGRRVRRKQPFSSSVWGVQDEQVFDVSPCR